MNHLTGQWILDGLLWLVIVLGTLMICAGRRR